ncbi:MAG: ABC-F family ATP-binding cassette domain-containing protein [Bacteroidales bacterium]
MISYLQVENITKSYGDLTLFKNISFGIAKDEKVALIAKNGTGKTTLLNIIAGSETPDVGEVIFRNDIKVGYLAQEPAMNPDLTVFDFIFNTSDEVLQAVRQYEEAMKHPESSNFNEALELMENLKAWDFEVKIKQILTKLNITNYKQKIETLSGGEAKRVALAAVLISEPDFLILDEPTNHLDLHMIEWLEDYLKKSASTLLMVTHDRYFLDRVCNDIIEFDEGEIFRYKGNYSYFIQKREERINNQEAEVEKAKNLLRKEEDWVKRMPKARGTKAKYRIDKYHELKDKASQTRNDERLNLDVEATRLGKKIINIKNLQKSFGENLFVKDFTYNFSRFEKVGIVGPNGCGKTTLLNILAGLDKPDSGMIDIGETLKIGYYKQEGIQFDEEQRVIDTVQEIADRIDMGDGRVFTAKQFLRYFLFNDKMQYVKVAKLSGGEKRRLYLLTVLMKKPNFLILDEPTNDLDIMTLGVLEEYLASFNGCVVIVSHDRYFLDNIVDHLFVFQDAGKIKNFPGNYSQYRDSVKDSLVKEKKKTKKQPKTKKEKQKKSVSYNVKKEFEQLGQEIEELENEKKHLEDELGNREMDNDEMVEKSNRIGELIKMLDEKTERWFELSEMIDS